MATPQKEISIQEITADFNESDAAVLTEYRGLTVAQLKTLRRSLGADTKYAVVKNTLTGIAAKAAGIDAFDGQLSGPTAIAFIKGDPVQAAKGLTDFAKDNEKLIIKAGVFEGQSMDAAEIAALAALESREHQLARVAAVLKAPMSTMARAAAALQAKQDESAEAPAEA
ncbi:MAG: 50S ribosomal protein L10 [Galactobacter sp.]